MCNLTRTPTKDERDDFAAFCRRASAAQLDAIISKESAANRRVYADIASSELERR